MKSEAWTLERIGKTRAGAALLAGIEQEERAEREWAAAARELADLREKWPGRLAALQQKKGEARQEVERARQAYHDAKRELGEIFNAEIVGIEAFNKRENELRDVLFQNCPKEWPGELADLREKLAASFNEAVEFPTATDLRKRRVYVDTSKKEALIRKREDLRAEIERMEKKIEGQS